MTVEQPDVAPTVVPWATAEDVPDAVSGAVDAAQLDDALAAASAILWALTGRRWAGVRASTVAVEPWRCGCWDAVYALGVPGSYGTYGGGDSHLIHDRQCLRADRRLALPDYPVQAVSSVVAPDLTYGADDVTVINGRALALTPMNVGAERHWPHRRYVVTYTHGTPPPVEGRRYAALYAGQLALAATPGAKDCRLPTRVQTVTRQGVTLAMLDPFEFLDKGRTGLVDVDTWIAAVNPHRLTSRPKVWSPDVAQRIEYRRP